jgi:CRISPR-associated protein Cas1
LLDAGHPVIRYADDFAVPTSTREEASAVVVTAREAALAHGLDLSPDKLSVQDFDEGVTFLGQVVTSGTGARADRQAHPTATTVYVTEQGALLRKKGNRLCVDRRGQAPFTIAFARVRQIVVFGRVGVTTPLLHALLTQGIELVLLGERGQFFGRLQGSSGSNPFVRDAQYRAASQGDVALDIARRIVAGKITNMRVALTSGACSPCSPTSPRGVACRTGSVPPSRRGPWPTN